MLKWASVAIPTLGRHSAGNRVAQRSGKTCIAYRLVDSTADHKGSVEGVARGAFTPIYLNLFLSDVKYQLIILRSYLSIWLIALALVVRILCDPSTNRCSGETGFKSCGSMTVVRAARGSSCCLASYKDVSHIQY
jgi:hypothetical protein